jgi:hypothetical protein
MKDFYLASLCFAVGCSFAVLPAFSADQSWQSKPGYFSSRGAYTGSPPDLIGGSAAELQIVGPGAAQTGIWQAREITNSTVIEPGAGVGGGTVLHGQQFIRRPQQNTIRMPVTTFGVVHFGLF